MTDRFSKPVLYWYFVSILQLSIFVICFKTGLFDIMIAADKSFISVSLIAIFVLHTMTIAYRIVTGEYNPTRLDNFIPPQYTHFGLIGTVVGFIMITHGLSNVNLSNGESGLGSKDMQIMLLTLTNGLGTALFTTLTGMVLNFFVKVQFLALGKIDE